MKIIKTIIVTGGNIDENFLKNFLYDYDKIIAVDNGLQILDKLNVFPNYIIGDFDTIDEKILGKYRNKKDIKIIKYPSKKDFTDTELAIDLAIEIKSSDVNIIGGIGTRVDHTLGNIHAMYKCLEKKIDIKIIDERNEIYLINKDSSVIESDKKYISLIPLTSIVSGLTLTGFKYNLENANLYIGKTVGISNELIEQEGFIKIKEGILIIIKSKD